MKKLKVYIAGPYTSGDQAVNVANAVKVADKLFKQGFIPYIPHLMHFWHMICPHEYDEWMMLDIEWLATCDLFFRLPGESPGADVEERKAVDRCIPVFYNMDKLVRWTVLNR